MSIDVRNNHIQFLAGGGEMGELTRNKNWDDTVVGNPGSWPQSLRTALSIILNSKFPMFLFWGPELTCFYNDAYRPSLGNDGKHPSILGQPAKKAWPEIWDIIKPLIDQVLGSGEATWSEDQLIPIYRNAKIEDAYWTFSYSPVNDESNKPAGVFVTCTETTDKVQTVKNLKDNKDQLEFAIEAAELGTFDYNPITDKFTANARLKDWFGLPHDEEIELHQVIEAIEGKDRQRVTEAIQNSMDFSSGGKYETEYTIVHPVSKKRTVVKAKGKASFTEEKVCYRLNGTLQDITDQIRALKQVEESERNLRLMIRQAPVAIAILRGADYKVEIANSRALEVWGRKEKEVLHQPILKAMPELPEQGIGDLLDNVYTSGEVFSATELPVRIERNGKLETVYINFSYEPLHDGNGDIDGIIAIGVDVTPQALARFKVEESEQRVRTMVENAPFPIGVYVGKEMRIEMANPSIMDVWGKGDKVIGKLYKEILPELDNHEVFEQVERVFTTGKPFHAKNQRIDLVTEDKLQPYYFNYSFTPLYDATGEVYAVMNMAADVTELNRAKQEIEEKVSELNLFKFMADNAFDPFILMRADGSFAYLNHMAMEKWGYDKEEIENIRVPDVDPIHNAEKFSEAFQLAQKQEIPAFETLHKNKAGTTYPVEINMGRLVLDNEPFMFAIARDITERKKTEEKLKDAFQKIEQSEKRFRNIVEQAPLGITIFRGAEFMVEMANESYLQIVDKKESDFVGIPLFTALPEVKEAVGPLLNDVIRTGTPFHGTEFPVTLNRYGKAELTYFNFVYHPLREDNGDISGIIVVATEVTPSVKAKETLAKSEKHFRTMVEQSPIPMTILRGKDFVIEMANTNMYDKIWLRNEDDTAGRSLLEVFPELKEQKYPELLRKVYRTGQSHAEIESIAYVQRGDGLQKFYLDFEYAPLLDPKGEVDGLVITVNDVTDRVEAREKVEAAEARARLAAEATELATWELAIDSRDIIYSDRLPEIFGHPSGGKFTHQQMREQVHAEDKPIVKNAFNKALKNGRYFYEARVVKANGSICWVRTQGRVFYDENKKPTKLIGTLRDITEEKQYQQELIESEQKFRLLADSMPQQIWTADTEGNLNYFNKSVYDYSGITTEQMAKEGWLQIVHPDDREENIKRWIHAVKTGEDFLFEHRFMRHDGAYRWQLSRAIPQRDVAGNIQMWVGTSTDIQEQKMFTRELEKQVQERTRLLKEANEKLEYSNKELKNMNVELKSFAYVSSHDLQEPLRKIQTFASRILEKEAGNLTDIGQDYFKRMQNAANRMQTLIEDLLAYSRTNTTQRVFEKINLGKIVEEVKTELKDTIAENNVTVDVGKMIEVNVITFQFKQLLHNLIGNSIKFSIPGIPPVIKIESKKIIGKNTTLDTLSPTKEYCHLSIADNGIGFDPKYKSRIFEVFQRLHGKSDYEGTGIGLAIVKKIVENHEGEITATGAINKGVTFDIYIPVEQ